MTDRNNYSVADLSKFYFTKMSFCTFAKKGLGEDLAKFPKALREATSRNIKNGVILYVYITLVAGFIWVVLRSPNDNGLVGICGI